MLLRDMEILPQGVLRVEPFGWWSASNWVNDIPGQDETRGFWRRVGIAFQRIVALFLFLGVHYLLTLVIKLVFPPMLQKMVELAEGFVSAFFLLIYIYLAWDVLVVFVPRLGRFGGKEKSNEGSTQVRAGAIGRAEETD